MKMLQERAAARGVAMPEQLTPKDSETTGSRRCSFCATFTQRPSTGQQWDILGEVGDPQPRDPKRTTIWSKQIEDHKNGVPRWTVSKAGLWDIILGR